MSEPSSHREFLKASLWGQWMEFERDQQKGVPPPCPQQPFPEDGARIDLEPPEHLSIGSLPLLNVINKRRSRRAFTAEPLGLDDLSLLVWTTQGVQEVLEDGLAVLRTVPSAGARHAFETYLVVNRVEHVEPGLYRYLSMDHQLGLLRADRNIGQEVVEGCYGQEFVGESAVVFVWTAVPYRMEWRYGPIAGKLIALDAGHVCQNLYLACESIGAGACAIAAYNQAKMDSITGVDGRDEFVVYLAPVGKVK